jgi:hypothetical protein
MIDVAAGILGLVSAGIFLAHAVDVIAVNRTDVHLRLSTTEPVKGANAMKPISEQLAELTVGAKSAEDAMAAAQKEAHDKIEARKEQARAAAKSATEKIDRELKSVVSSAAKDWDAVRAKIAADIASPKANIADAKHGHDVKRAESRADRLEWEAGFAIDYAIASVEQAKLAVLDAIDGRVASRAVRRDRDGRTSFPNRSAKIRRRQ